MSLATYALILDSLQTTIEHILQQILHFDWPWSLGSIGVAFIEFKSQDVPSFIL